MQYYRFSGLQCELYAIPFAQSVVFLQKFYYVNSHSPNIKTADHWCEEL